MSHSARTIAIVLHDLPLGGTERIALRLANRWAAQDRKVTLICGSRQGALADMVGDGPRLVECDPPIPRARGSRRALGRAAADYLAAHAPDVVFVPGNYHWPVLPQLARLPQPLAPGVVAQVSTPLFRYGRGPLKQVVYNLRTRRQLRHADAAVALSPCMAQDTDRIAGRRLAQWLRLPALDDQCERPLSQARGRTILAAGRLAKVKGFDVAIRAFARLNDPTARLVIVGEGPERENLMALAASLGVAERVRLPGYARDIRPWLDEARVFLLSSFWEGYAAVVVEALAAGRPVVATDCTPAAGELLIGRGGRVAGVGDVDGLAACLRQELDAPAPDPERLASLVSGFRIGPISEAYLQIFDEVKARRLHAQSQVTAHGWRASVRGGLRPAPA